MPVKRAATKPTPETQLQAGIAKLPAKQQVLFKTIRTALRKRVPSANELVYQYSHAFVISYSPTDHGIDGILTISAKADGLFLYFGQGPKLPDPTGILQGKGKQTRFTELKTAGDLKRPDVTALIDVTIAQAKTALPSTGKGAVIIRTSGAKKPRPAAAKTKKG